MEALRLALSLSISKVDLEDLWMGSFLSKKGFEKMNKELNDTWSDKGDFDFIRSSEGLASESQGDKNKKSESEFHFWNKNITLGLEYCELVSLSVRIRERF